MEASHKLKSIIEDMRANNSYLTLKRIKAQIDSLQKDINSDLHKCREQLVSKKRGIEDIHRGLQYKQNEIKKLQIKIQNLELTVKGLIDGARRFDNEAEILEGKSEIRARQHWFAMGAAVAGNLLASVFGYTFLGLPAVLCALAILSLTDANMIRAHAEEKRTCAERKRSDVQYKREEIKTIQHFIETDTRIKMELVSAIQLFESENRIVDHVHIINSALEFLLDLKTESSNYLETAIQVLTSKEHSYDREARKLNAKAMMRQDQGIIASMCVFVFIVPVLCSPPIIVTGLGLLLVTGGLAVLLFQDHARQKADGVERRNIADRTTQELHCMTETIKARRDDVEADIRIKSEQLISIQTLHTEIAYLENMLSNLSSFEFLIGFKIETSTETPVHERISHVRHSSSPSEADYFADKVDKELLSIISNLNKARVWASNGHHICEYINTVLPRTIERVKVCKNAVQAKYNQIWRQNETQDLNDVLESTRKSIIEVQENIAESMIGRVESNLREKMACKQLQKEEKGLLLEISSMKRRIEELEAMKRNLRKEASELDGKARENRDYLTQRTSGSEDLIREAERTTSQALKLEVDILDIKMQVHKLNDKVYMTDARLKVGNFIIETLTEDQEVLRDILQQLTQFTAVVDSILESLK